MLTSTIILTTLAALASSLPTSSNLSPRAGGPAAKPIPSSCSVKNPLPPTSADKTYLPGPSTNNVSLYAAYYPPLANKTAMSEKCLQQCYGYGDSTECKTAYWAENIVVPAGYYGSTGGQLETACLFYTRTLAAEDFAEAPHGQATTPFAGNIEC